MLYKLCRKIYNPPLRNFLGPGNNLKPDFDISNETKFSLSQVFMNSTFCILKYKKLQVTAISLEERTSPDFKFH